MARQRFGKKSRLSKRQDISHVFDHGRRAVDRLLTVLAAPNDMGRARLAVAVSKRHGNAVHRNRLKRLCREAFRAVSSELPPCFDYVILPRVGRKFNLEELTAAVKSLAIRASGQAIAASAEKGKRQ